MWQRACGSKGLDTKYGLGAEQRRHNIRKNCRSRDKNLNLGIKKKECDSIVFLGAKACPCLGDKCLWGLRTYGWIWSPAGRGGRNLFAAHPREGKPHESHMKTTSFFLSHRKARDKSLRSRKNHMKTTCKPHENHMKTTWKPHENHRFCFIPQTSARSIFEKPQKPHENHVKATWKPHPFFHPPEKRGINFGEAAKATWKPHENHMKATWKPHPFFIPQKSAG